MALASPLPPWLNIGPQTFLGAMEGGGRLGLGARAQDVKQEVAADRLSMAYDALASKEQMASEALQGKLQLGQMQQEYKQSALDERNLSTAQRLAETQAHNIGMEGLRRDQLALATETAKARIAQAKAKAAGGGTPSPFLKELNEYFDLAQAAQKGDPKAAYQAKAMYENIERTLEGKDPLRRQRATALFKELQQQHLIATAPNVTAERRAQAQRDYEAASNSLTNLLESSIEPLPFNIMTGPSPQPSQPLPIQPGTNNPWAERFAPPNLPNDKLPILPLK